MQKRTGERGNWRLTCARVSVWGLKKLGFRVYIGAKVLVNAQSLLRVIRILVDNKTKT